MSREKSNVSDTHILRKFFNCPALLQRYQSVILYIDVIEQIQVRATEKELNTHVDLFMQSDWIESLIHTILRARPFRVKNMSKIKLIAMKIRIYDVVIYN